MREIKALEDARVALAELFDATIWYYVEDCTEDPWSDYGYLHSTVGYQLDTSVEPDEEEGYDFLYAMKVYGTSRWEATTDEGTFVLFVGDDGCGNRLMYLFDKSNYLERS